MKLTLRIIGTIAVVLLGIGVTLYILMQWGALVEYHAFEWRGIVTAKSPYNTGASNRESQLFFPEYWHSIRSYCHSSKNHYLRA